MYSENLPPIYKSALSKMRKRLEYEYGYDAIHNSLKYFASNYWPANKFGDWMLDLDYNETGVAINTKPWIFHQAIKEKCQKYFEKGFQDAEKVLIIPCEALEKTYEIYQQYSTKPIPKLLKEKYLKALALKTEMRAIKSNIEAFMEIVNKLDDNELIISCFEYFMRKHYTDKTIWKYYINFLSNVDKKKMFMAYKHYTRFFIEDKEMVKEYREKIEEFSKTKNSVSFWVADTIAWELKFGDKKHGYTMLEEYLNSISFYEKYDLSNISSLEQLYKQFRVNGNRTVAQNLMGIFSLFELIENNNSYENYAEVEFNDIKDIKKPMIKVNFEIVKKQDFDFPTPLLRYTFEHVSLTVLQKLYESCKYFFSTFNTPLCYRLIIGGTKTQYHEQSLQISDVDFQKPKFQELIKRIKIVNCLQWNLNDDKKSFTDFIQKENIKEIKHIFVKNDEMSTDKLTILLSTL